MSNFLLNKKREKNGRHTYSLFTVIKKYEISYYIRIINTHSFVLTIFFYVNSYQFQWKS